MKAIVWIDYTQVSYGVILGSKTDEDQLLEARFFEHPDVNAYKLLGNDTFEGNVQDDQLANFLISKGFIEKQLSAPQLRRVVSHMVFSAAELLVKAK